MTEATSLVRAHRLQAHHGRHLVLNETTFALRGGRATAVLGRNGAGKTTLARTVMGLHPLTAGTLMVLDRDITRWQPWRRNRLGIALVPQGRHVFRELTPAENLGVVTTTADSPTLDELFELFPRLAHRARLRAANLSGGEQQMLAIARALRTGPRVLILDEPSEGLAPLIVEEVARLIRRLRDKGLTILLAEQNLKLAFDVADHTLILDHGRIAFDDAASVLQVREDILQTHLGL